MVYFERMMTRWYFQALQAGLINYLMGPRCSRRVTYVPVNQSYWRNSVWFSITTHIQSLASKINHHQSTWAMDAPGVLSCNHNAVHHGALGLAALALWNSDVPEKARWLQTAIGRVDEYLGAFIDGTGYGTEGHHYFAYGLGGVAAYLPGHWRDQMALT